MSAKERCAVLTMVWKSYKMLDKWRSHYEKEFGAERLFVISHGNDVRHDTLLKGCNVIHVPRELTSSFDDMRFSALSHYAAMLLKFFETVIVCDVDELICIDPATNLSLDDYIASLKHGIVYAPLGFHLLPKSLVSTVDWSKPLLEQTRSVFPDGRYTKPSILKCEAEIGAGGHSISGKDFVIDHNMLMFHLKYLPNEETDQYNNDVSRTLHAGATSIDQLKNANIGTHWIRGKPAVDRRLAEMMSVESINGDDGLKRTKRQVDARYIKRDGLSFVRRIRKLKYDLPVRFLNSL